MESQIVASDSTSQKEVQLVKLVKVSSFNRERILPYLTPLAIIIGSVFVSASILYTKPENKIPNVDSVLNSNNGEVSIDTIETSKSPFIGNADALLTIAYWSDFQCPFCKVFETETMQNVIKDYVDQGKVKIVFKDFQFLGPDSTIAALAARSMWKLYPNQYFTWREAMFNAQDEEHGGFGDKESIIILTQKIPGIDVEKLEQDLIAHEGEYLQAITDDRLQGQKIGVEGTPAILIGKRVIPGAIGYSDLKPVIEDELK